MTDFKNTPELSESTEPAISYSTCYQQPFLSVYLSDCLEIMRTFKDKEFDLAIVDVPYGIGEDGSKNHTRGKLAKPQDYKPYAGNDANAPSKEYWDELLRISKNQIVWGANHFISKLPFDSSCWIVWDKDNTGDFADCELAWTSFDTAVRKFKWTWNGMLQQNMKDKQKRIHPNEKPIQLYEWLLKNYAKEGNKIIDTHFGSGSIALAVDKVNNLDKMDLHLTAIELDEHYYNKSIKRINQKLSQGTMSF
jgi:site-specific DNA-methyltransferase (adenine-specific)